MAAPPGMNPAIYDAMALAGENQVSSHDNPEAPIPIVGQTGEERMIDPAALAAEGMVFAGNYMASNGPTQASHIGKARQMTKGQLREQKMNEEQGYPSNLDEAEKVKELESKVANIESGIGQILAKMEGRVTPALRSAAQSYLEDRSSQASPVSNAPIGGSPEFPDEQKTATAVLGTASPQSPRLTGLNELSEPENRQPKLRQVTLKDGRKINVPAVTSPATPMSLGLATDQTEPPTQLEDEADSDWDDPVAVLPEPEQEVSDPTPDPKLAQTQQLVQDVNAFIQSNDVHRFWRRHISRNLHRHVGYNGWPKELQNEFNERFKGFLQDPQFVTSICKKIIGMELGPAIGSKHVVSFLVATAGFTAFALCGLDN